MKKKRCEAYMWNSHVEFVVTYSLEKLRPIIKIITDPGSQVSWVETKKKKKRIE